MIEDIDIENFGPQSTLDDDGDADGDGVEEDDWN